MISLDASGGKDSIGMIGFVEGYLLPILQSSNRPCHDLQARLSIGLGFRNMLSEICGLRDRVLCLYSTSRRIAVLIVAHSVSYLDVYLLVRVCTCTTSSSVRVFSLVGTHVH